MTWIAWFIVWKLQTFLKLLFQELNCASEAHLSCFYFNLKGGWFEAKIGVGLRWGGLEVYLKLSWGWVGVELTLD